MVLDMAPYISDAAAEDGEEAGEGGDGGTPAPAPEVGDQAFGLDGARIAAVDKAACLEDGTLPYDLFAVLIHRGTAAFGHYYAYIKDFQTGKWLDFNDATVTALQEADIKRAFGGKVAPSYGTYGGGASSQSSASAYMLMYRRRAECNINELSAEMVPAPLLEEIKQQAEETKAKQAEALAKKQELAVNVYHGSRAVCLSLDRQAEWGAVRQRVLDELGGLEGVGVESADCWRLRTIKFLHDDYPDEVMEDEDATPLIKVKNVKTYGATDLLIETKVAGAEWPKTYGEFGPLGHQHHKVFKLAIYTPPAGDEDGAVGAFSPWQPIMFGYVRAPPLPSCYAAARLRAWWWCVACDDWGHPHRSGGNLRHGARREDLQGDCAHGKGERGGGDG